MAILDSGDKFCLLSVEGCVSAPQTDVQLSDGTWALTKLPVELSPTWQKSIGELRTNALQRANFLLLRTLPNGSPGNLDDEHEQLKREVTDTFWLLQLSGPLRYQTATAMLGRADSQGDIISQVIQLKHFYETRGTPLPAVTEQRLEEAVASRQVRAQMRGKPEFARFGRGISILTEGLAEYAGSERLHQFLRSLEALILPETGKTRKQLISRAKLLTTASVGTGLVLGQLFDMRSDIEHVHDLSRTIQYLPATDREAVALRRTRQAEALACFAYRRVFADAALRVNFESDHTIHDFWVQDQLAVRKVWSQSLDLLAVP